MRRPAHAEDTLARIRAWRRACPELTLRSTFIVGFPGETEAEFAQLLAWLEEAQLDRVGCFKYSPVEGAAANALGGHVPPELQEERYARFMERAADDQRARGSRHGRRRARACSWMRLQDGVAIARSAAEAPEIDGVTGCGAEKTSPASSPARRTSQPQGWREEHQLPQGRRVGRCRDRGRRRLRSHRPPQRALALRRPAGVSQLEFMPSDCMIFVRLVLDRLSLVHRRWCNRPRRRRSWHRSRRTSSRRRRTWRRPALSLVTPFGRWCDFESMFTRLSIASTIFGTSLLDVPQASLAFASAACASCCLGPRRVLQPADRGIDGSAWQRARPCSRPWRGCPWRY